MFEPEVKKLYKTTNKLICYEHPYKLLQSEVYNLETKSVILLLELDLNQPYSKNYCLVYLLNKNMIVEIDKSFFNDSDIILLET